MPKYYTNERNIQILISLLKAHNIKKIVASPGTTNVCFVGSLQQDPFFEIFSSVDERSAAYLACGIASECGEPVVLTCTGATASRNYVPGLTEAYYRKLPVIAVTASQHLGHSGQMFPQMIDRTAQMKDLVKLSVQLPSAHTAEDEWACNTAVNKALLEARRHGGGSVHINLVTTYSTDFSVKALPSERVINRITKADTFPDLKGKRVAIFVGSHKKWSDSLTRALDAFCATHDSVVLCDHTSNYRGEYRVFPSIVTSQDQYAPSCKFPDVLVHIGEVSGAYYSLHPKEVWRVNEDGEVRDVFKKLRYVFEMSEAEFFEQYADEAENSPRLTAYKSEWQNECQNLLAKVPDLPFSNIWIAQQTSHRLPENCALHLGILHSLRSWNFFDTPPSIAGFSNTGGFGIDGGLSALVGASLADREKLFFGIIGDLAFFYDMNVLGNRHLGKNLRIMLMNNGRGTEFRNYNHPAERFGDEADRYMAAAGHFGNKSRQLVKHYASDLGFEYMCAENKEEYLKNLERFLTPQITEKPMLLEVFTDSKDESKALEMICNLDKDIKGIATQTAKKLLGAKSKEFIKKLLRM